ncbi:MAG: hypothetical protein HYT79_11470 [Elusimicrobia bacterium]|nr:hypothetical protein [Elusimicrobiota bacterium]
MDQTGRKSIAYAAGAMALGIIIGSALKSPDLRAQVNQLEQRAVRLNQQFGDAVTSTTGDTQPDLETRVGRLERLTREIDRDLSWLQMDVRSLQSRVSHLESRIRRTDSE